MHPPFWPISVNPKCLQGDASDIDLHCLFVASPDSVITIGEEIAGVAEEARADSDAETPVQHAGNLQRACVSRRNLLAMTKHHVAIQPSSVQIVSMKGNPSEKNLI